MASEVHQKLADRAEEMIESRVGTFFVGLPKAEEDKIVKAAKVVLAANKGHT